MPNAYRLPKLCLAIAAALSIFACQSASSQPSASQTASGETASLKSDLPVRGPFKAAEFTKPTDEELRQRLDAMQYRVTQEDGTEPAFRNEYWDNKKRGLYVDIVSGEPLFSSEEKFKSGTGWPSFYEPLVPDLIVEKSDRKFGMVRTEVRSKHGDSHLGHLFPDGPKPTGLRYCINSASLRFIPIEDLASEGYEDWISHFDDKKAKK